MGNQETHCPLFISTKVSLNARENRMGNQETHCPLFIRTNISLNDRQNRMGNQETHCPLFISTNISLNARENRRDNQETHCLWHLQVSNQQSQWASETGTIYVSIVHAIFIFVRFITCDYMPDPFLLH